MTDAFRRPSRTAALAVALSALVFVGTADFYSSLHLRATLFFYFIPLAVVAWFARWWISIPFVFLTVGTIFAAEAAGGLFAHGFEGAVLDAVLQVAIFIGATYAIAQARITIEDRNKLLLVDPMTGLWNLRGLYHLTEKEISRSRRAGRPFTLLYLDLDDFSLWNARLNRQAGDDLLAASARAIVQSVRRSDSATRIGPDDFVVLMPETGLEAARTAMARVRAALAEKFQKYGWAMTVSVGCLVFHAVPDDADGAIDKLQNLSFELKKIGKKSATIETVIAP